MNFNDHNFVMCHFTGVPRRLVDRKRFGYGKLPLNKLLIPMNEKQPWDISNYYKVSRPDRCLEILAFPWDLQD